jgi:hypothetical protein
VVVMMRSLPMIGLAWTALLAAGTAGTAQTTIERSLPPVRLPGVIYPGDTRAAPKLELKKQASQPTIVPVMPVPEQKQTSRSIIAPVTPAPEPSHHTVAIEPTQPGYAVPQFILNKQEVPAPAVIVASGAESVPPVEPLASSPHAILKVIIPAEVGTIVTGTVLAAGFLLGYAVRAFVSRRRRLHAKKYRGLDRVPIW